MSFIKALPALLITAALGLTACSTPATEPNTSAVNKDVATGGSKFGTADIETAKFGSDAEPGQFPRTVKHAAGTTEIKEKPKRIVVLENGELDGVLTLGITPVGMTTSKGENPIPSYLADKLEGVTTVGTINEVNVEAIAALQPDLILGNQLRADKLYPQLSQIAPTVFSIRPGFPWKENFLLIGETLGMEKEAEAKLQQYHEAVSGLGNSVPDGTTVSLVRFMPGKLRLYGRKSLIGVILQDAGLVRPAEQDIDELAVEISPETIDKADGSIIFYTSYGTPAATGETAVIESSSWKALPAVAEGKAHRVNDDVWYLGLGPTGAMQIVSDLKELLPKK